MPSIRILLLALCLCLAACVAARQTPTTTESQVQTALPGEPGEETEYLRPDRTGYDPEDIPGPSAYCSPLPQATTRPSFSLAAAQHPLANELHFMLEAPELFRSWVGFMAVDLDTGPGTDVVLYQRNEDMLFTPASTMKLVTTAAALDILGPEFRFTTRIVATGPIANGVLMGDLVVIGSGDPTIPSFRADDPYAVFRSWADRLKAMGIRSIQGAVVGVDTAFTGNALGPGWNWDDESFWYAAQTSSLNFNDNCVYVTVKAGSGSSPVSWTMNPDNGYVRIQNHSSTRDQSEREFTFRRRDGTNTIDLIGEFRRARRGLTAPVAIDDPAAWFVHSLDHALSQSGITVGGQPRVDRRPEAASPPALLPLFEHRSPPLADIIRTTNVESHNLYAEVLLRTLGLTRCGEGSLEGGTAVVTAWMRTLGVEERDFLMQDGSGLSRKNLITPRALLTVLAYMADISPHGRTFMASLPLAGVDGTLMSRMRGTPAEKTLRGKTGSMELVSNLAGVTLNGQGHRIAFVMLTNNHTLKSREMRNLEDKVAAVLSR